MLVSASAGFGVQMHAGSPYRVRVYHNVNLDYHVHMQLPERDLKTIQLVSKFSQLTSAHIQQLLFSDNLSTNPMYRALTRLKASGFLAPVEIPLPGGSRGGRGQYVWQLGIEGWKLCREGRYLPARAVRYHTLAIADVYVTLVNLERAGKLNILGYSTEPDSYVTIDPFELKPDLYAELRRPSGPTIRIMFEIDMGTQGQRQIADKFSRYWGAHQAADAGVWPDNQLVLFVAIDQHRADELKWLLERGSAEQQQLFRVQTQQGLAAALAG